MNITQNTFYLEGKIVGWTKPEALTFGNNYSTNKLILTITNYNTYDGKPNKFFIDILCGDMKMKDFIECCERANLVVIEGALTSPSYVDKMGNERGFLKLTPLNICFPQIGKMVKFKDRFYSPPTADYPETSFVPNQQSTYPKQENGGMPSGVQDDPLSF